MASSGCTIIALLFQLWSPSGCCNLVVSLVRYGISLTLIFSSMSSHSGTPLLVCLYPRTSQPQRFSRWLVSCRARVYFQFRCCLFLVRRYPRPCIPSTEIQPLADILQCTLSLSECGCYLFWSPLPCILRCLASVLSA